MSTKAPDIVADVVVVGAGMVGGTLACLLAGAGLATVVVERAPQSTALDPRFDGRASSIAHSTHQVFRAAGLWPELAAEATAILDIRVSDGPSSLFLHFAHHEVGDTPFGYMVENRHIRHALSRRHGALESLTLLAPASVADVVRGADGVVLTLEDGRRLLAPLLVAADGRGSTIRERAGIALTRWAYDQVGIVCSVRHEKPHNNTAHERFLPSGPFAILPLAGNRSCIVWTQEKALAPAIMALDDRDFAGELRRRFGDFLGEVDPETQRWSYPLALQFADRLIDRRLALAGDVAHGMHPIAGQGLNMGLRDVAALAEVVVDATRLGLDPGSGVVLDRYARWRRFDNTLMLAMTDLLNRLFSNDIAPVRLARDLGLAAVNRAGPLKKMVMKQAMGLTGDLPRLLRGGTL